MRDFALIYLNGQRTEIRGEIATLMLADWLRKEASLTGTKIVCAEGDCGACTVLVAFQEPGSTEKPRFEAINSCVIKVAQLDGAHIVTIEGIACANELSPVQAAMQKCHGSQCGYCTPGFVMSLTAMLEHNKKIDKKNVLNYTTGNLCRCTGYEPIINSANVIELSEKHSVTNRYLSTSSLAELDSTHKESLYIKNSEQHFYAPITLTEAVSFLNENSNSNIKIIGAGSDLGVQENKHKFKADILLSLHHIPELYKIKESENTVTVGSRVTISQLRRAIKNESPEFADFLNIFASPQIKNVATLVGNVANASPVGDTIPFLLVSEAIIHVQGINYTKDIPIQEFYLGYKKIALNKSEIITSITFNLSQKNEVLGLYKVSTRKDLDISTISSAFLLKTTSQNQTHDSKNILKIESAKIAFGGVAATPIRLPKIEEHLKGISLSHENIDKLAEEITSTIKPISDLRGSATFRRVLAMNTFKKFSHKILKKKPLLEREKHG